MLQASLLRERGWVGDARLLEGRVEEVRHDEGVRQVGHHRVVLGVHDLLVGHIEKAKPILAKADLKHFKVNKNETKMAICLKN